MNPFDDKKLSILRGDTPREKAMLPSYPLLKDGTTEEEISLERLELFRGIVKRKGLVPTETMETKEEGVTEIMMMFKIPEAAFLIKQKTAYPEEFIDRILTSIENRMLYWARERVKALDIVLVSFSYLAGLTFLTYGLVKDDLILSTLGMLGCIAPSIHIFKLGRIK